ncbi:hypothetical protein TPHV1_510055 [Treponema phagedenis]|uniref:Transposase n=1 Tax=Treponema phagedenis TaxID=162 RepID=A0A0B7GWV3_TREPH|nr:hypothetical protein TPHV1_510055 [Treponema phagedenis]
MSKKPKLHSERARTPVVPNRNEFENYHTSIVGCLNFFVKKYSDSLKR